MGYWESGLSLQIRRCGMEFIKKSFKRELLAGFLIVALLPLVLCCAFLIQMFKAKLASDYQKQDMEQAATIEERLTTLFQEFDRVTESVGKDGAIQDSMMGNGSRNAVYSRLYEATAGLREAAQFDIYSGEGICQYSTGTGTVHTKLPVYWGIMKVAAAHPEELIIRREKEYLGDSDILLRAVRAIRDEEADILGYIVVSMREAHFESVLKGTYSSQDGVCILNSFWETVYSTEAASREEIGAVLRKRVMDGKDILEPYHNNWIYVSRLGETGLMSVFLRPEVFTADTTRSMYSVLLIMAAASLLLCIVVAARMSNHLSWPIRVLNRAMQELQEGNLDTRITSCRTDEFGQLSNNFNVMAKELKNYMERQVSQQKELNDVQIAMMQAQLNPHFLYNTLDTMKWVAKANHIPEIATLAAKLAKILRTSISRDQLITLQEEMELVESYAEIQRIRFNGKFRFEYVLPKKLQACIIPKLIVQPIVENSVIHGLAECEEGTIRVAASEDGGMLTIEVTDDGCGISPEVMERLNSRDREKLAGHIGFYNVDTIIRLHYGEEYGLKVDRPESGGTRVVIAIPLTRKGGKQDVEGIGSR